jgi:hypothetical protein
MLAADRGCNVVVIVSVMTMSEMIQAPRTTEQHQLHLRPFKFSREGNVWYPKVSLACQRSNKTELCAAKQILAALEP